MCSFFLPRGVYVRSEDECSTVANWFFLSDHRLVTMANGGSSRHRCKNVFLRFYFGRVFYVFLTVLFSKRFYLKNVGKVQSGKQINKKHFQNNSNEIDLWFFCCMSNDLIHLPINFYLLRPTMFDALCHSLEGHFLGIRRGVELH